MRWAAGRHSTASAQSAPKACRAATARLSSRGMLPGRPGFPQSSGVSDRGQRAASDERMKLPAKKAELPGSDVRLRVTSPPLPISTQASVSSLSVRRCAMRRRSALVVGPDTTAVSLLEEGSHGHLRRAGPRCKCKIGLVSQELKMRIDASRPAPLAINCATEV